MPKYKVYGTVSGGKYLGEFEAATPEEAKEIAVDSGDAHVSLCHHCSRQCEGAEIVDVEVELVDE